MIRETEESEAYAFVAPIALLPEYQGKGLGLELLKCGIETGYANGLDNAMLVVNSENDKALGLYNKAGFELDMAVQLLRKSMKE